MIVSSDVNDASELVFSRPSLPQFCHDDKPTRPHNKLHLISNNRAFFARKHRSFAHPRCKFSTVDNISNCKTRLSAHVLSHVIFGQYFTGRLILFYRRQRACVPCPTSSRPSSASTSPRASVTRPGSSNSPLSK